jgi:2'-5' RNA ligase
MHVDALRREALGPVRATWGVERISLMRSHLTRTGARYEVVHDARLGGDAEA